MDKYLIPKDIKSQIKFGLFNLSDIVVIFAVMAVWYILIQQTSFGFLINLMLFIGHGIFALFLIMRTKDNPDRPRISIMLSALLNQDDTNYHSIDYNKYKNHSN